MQFGIYCMSKLKKLPEATWFVNSLLCGVLNLLSCTLAIWLLIGELLWCLHISARIILYDQFRGFVRRSTSAHQLFISWDEAEEFLHHSSTLTRCLQSQRDSERGNLILIILCDEVGWLTRSDSARYLSVVGWWSRDGFSAILWPLEPVLRMNESDYPRDHVQLDSYPTFLGQGEVYTSSPPYFQPIDWTQLRSGVRRVGEITTVLVNLSSEYPVWLG